MNSVHHLANFRRLVCGCIWIATIARNGVFFPKRFLSWGFKTLFASTSSCQFKPLNFSPAGICRPSLDRQRSSRSDRSRPSCNSGPTSLIPTSLIPTFRGSILSTQRIPRGRDLILPTQRIPRGNCGANSEEIVDFEERNERLHGRTEGLLDLEF